MSNPKWSLVWPRPKRNKGNLILVKNCIEPYDTLGRYLSTNREGVQDYISSNALLCQRDKNSFFSLDIKSGCGSCWRYAAIESPDLWNNLQLPQEMDFRWVVGNRNVIIIDDLGQRILSEKRFYE